MPFRVGLAVCLLAAVAGLPLAEANAAPAAEALRGQRLLGQYQCGACHRIPGVVGATSALAAPLDGFGKRSYIAGRLANRPALLARWIAAPQSLVPGTPMPDMGVTPDDARAMAAYLSSLQ